MKPTLRAFRALVLLCLCVTLPLRAEAPADPVLNGAVLDPSGAAIPHATIRLHSASGDRNTTADDAGHFSLTAPAATYSITVDSPGFRTYTRDAFVVAAAHNPALNITLEIATDTVEVSVSANDGLSTDAAGNKNALVFKEDRLDTFSDDPAIMQQQLLALGGVDPTDPPQLYIDGFSGGQMPPKNTIREVRLNQNPFSAQYDQFGASRIEIFTKPGTNKFHGSVEGNLGNSALNSLNPFASGLQPSYSTNFLNAGLNGPLGKKSSFFVTANRFDHQNNAIVDAVTLDSNLSTVNISQGVPNPTLNQVYSARIDRQFGANDTFVGRYTFAGNNLINPGIGQFILPSQGSLSDTHTQTLQLADTHLFGAKVVFDSSFQYIRARLRQDAASSAFTRVVQGAFSDGGNPAQSLHDSQDRLEFQEYLSIAHGTHFIRTGLRYRLLRDANLNTAGTNGQFVFPDLNSYRITLAGIQQGLTPAAIRAMGGGASQFSLVAGTPSASVFSSDAGAYAEDEWKTTPNFSLIYGLRLESQSAIPTRINVAPRLGFAWSILPDKKAKQPILVLRGGGGVFYQRFASGNILQSLRQNGTTQQVFYINNPDFYPNIPTPASLSATPSTVYQINPNLHEPEAFFGRLTAEHSFGSYGTLTVEFGVRRTIHMFESRNINAPLPGTYDPSIPTSGVRPLGGLQNIYQFSSDGVSNARTLALNPNINVTKKLSLWAYFTMGHQESNTSGSFPSNSYNLGADAGRLGGFAARQLYSGINAKPGRDTSLNLFFAARSSAPFNITTGTDLNGDTQYNDRPAFATDLSRPSVVRTAYGNFDTSPLPGQTLVPINYGNGPGVMYLEISAGKSFRFGPRAPAPAGAAATGGKPAPLPPQKYRLQFGFEADNPLNHVNKGAPVGVLSSPLFGRSTSLNNQFNGGNSASRVITFHTGFYF